jgi:hypothetical protein
MIHRNGNEEIKINKILYDNESKMDRLLKENQSHPASPATEINS